jgi:hypothetical protein
MNAQTGSAAGAVQASGCYRFTFGTYDQAGDWTDRRELTWQELVSILTTHAVGPKEGTCIVPATFYGTRRKKLEAERIDVAFLDSDAGFTLDEIEGSIRHKGWAAIVSSSHSNLSTRTKVKRINWDRYVAKAAGEGTRAEFLPAGFLEEEKGYLPRVAEGARIAEEQGEYIFFEHQPCPKFRIAFPLATPWLAASYSKQAQANAVWKERIEALAEALDLDHDQACVDTSRLFFLPRRAPNGPPSETSVIEGQPCDIFALATPGQTLFGGGDDPAPKEAKQRTRTKKKPVDDAVEYADPQTGEVFDLARWSKRFGARFQIVDALRAVKPAIFTGHVADGVKHHILCANEEEHTNAGQDGATFIVNASEADNRGFVYHCRHGHCDGRDRLYFLRKILAEGWLTPADLMKKRFLVAEAVEVEGQPPAQDEQEEQYFQPPLIRYVGGKLPEIVDQAEDALIRSPAEIYQRGSIIVRPGMVRITVPKKGEIEMPSIIEMGTHALAEEMTRAADWEKYDGRAEDWVSIDAPAKIADTLRDRKGHWRLPTLSGIINAPTLRPDGSILATPGYDAATGLRLDLRGLKVPEILEYPTHDDADAARNLLVDLIGTFPFVNQASRSVALSAILTGVIRRSLRTAPLHAYTAPAAGSGKSILVDLACLICSGHEAPVIAQGKTEEEMEKRIGALLLAGDAFIPIDNCDAPLGGDILCQILTQTMVRARILGKSEAPKLPSNAMVTATGNNLILVGDMTRRALLCRIDAQCERPELRTFDRDPVETVKARRGRYLAAALTILRAFHVAGRPEQVAPLGSFRDWSDWVRGALIWLGEADPVSTMEEARASDPKLEALNNILEQWREVIGVGTELTVRELIERATEHSTGEWGKPIYRNPDFRAALLVVANDKGAVNSFRLGKWLGAHRDRVVSELVIEAGPQEKGLAKWKLSSKGKGE